MAKRPFRNKPMPVSDSQTQITRAANADNLKVNQLEAKQFELTDSNDKPRLTMIVDENNTVRLTLNSRNQSGNAILNMFENGRTAFILSGPRGRNRVSVSARQDWHPTIHLTEESNIILANEKNQPRVVLGEGQESGVKLFYYDRDRTLFEIIKKNPDDK